MDIDKSKENIQPLRGGRNAQQLGQALHALGDADAQRLLQLQRQEHEAVIQNYDGPDPLEPWFHYIQWVEQSFPKHGHEGQIDKLIKQCLTKFENDERYVQDGRFLRLWIKYIDYCSNPLELYQLLYDRGIGTTRSELYRAWACYFEEATDYNRAEQVYNLGLQADAQPKEELEQAHTSFQIWFAQRVLHNDSPTKRKAASALAETRLALTSLRTVKRRNVATVSSQRTGDGIYSRTPGVIRQCVDTRNQARSNVVIDVYDENPGPSSFPASYDAQSGMTASGPAPSLLQSCSMAENQKEVGIWSNSKTEKICTAKKMSVAPLPFTLYEDDLILATNHVPFCREDLSSYQVPLCVPDPPDDTKIPMYNKKEVYKDGESSTKEFSLEEIKARRYKRKFLLHKSKHKSTPDESLHLDTQSGSSSGIRILADCVVRHVSDEANYRTDQFAAGTVLDVQSAKAVELPNEPKIIVNLDSNCQFSEIGTIQIGAEFNLEKVIAQSNSVLNTDDNDACTLELRDNYGIFPSKRSYENDLKTDDIQGDENMLASNFNLVQNKCYTNELTKKNVIADFNRSLMADIHEDSMTVNTKEALRELNLFGENDSNPIIATIDAVKFEIREDHSMTMAAIQAKSTNRPNIENYENIGNENLCKETESDTQMDHRGNRIGLRSIQSAQKQIELDETSTQIFTFNVPSASTPYNNHFKKPQYLEPLKRPNMKGSNAFETGNASEKLVQNNSSPKEGSLKTSNNESAISELNPRGNDGLYPIMETTQEYRSGSSASGSSLTTRNTMLGYTARESSGLPLSVINEKHQDINTNQEPNHQHYLDSNAYGKKPAGIQGSSKMNHINVNYNFSNSDNKAHTISPSSPSHSNQQIVSQYHTLDHQYHKIPAGYNRYNSQRNMSQCYQNSNQQTSGIAANNGYQHHISYQNTTTNSNFNNSGFQGPLHQNPQINYQHAGYHSPQQRVQSPNPHTGFQSPSLIQPGFQSPQQGYASPQHGYTSPQQGFTSPQQVYQNQPNQQIYSNTPIPSVGFQSPTYSNSHQSFQNPSHNFANGQIFQQQHVYMNQNTSIINHTNYQSHETFSNNGQIQHYNPNHSYNNQNVLHQNNIKSSHPVNSYNNYHNNQAHQSLFTIQKNSGVQYAPNDSFQSHQEFSNESPAVLFKNSQQSNNSIGSQNTSQNKKSNDSQMDNNISHKHLSSPYHQNNIETQKQLYPSSTSKLRSVRHEVPHVTAKANAASQSLNPGFSNQYLSFISTCNESKDNANTPKFNNSPNISHKMHKNLYVSSPEQAQIPPSSDINVDIGKEGDLRILSSQNRASLSQHISDKNRDQSKRQLDFESRIDVHSEDSRDSASKESRMSSLHSRQSIRSMQADSFQMDIDSENSMDCHMLTFKSNCSNSLISTQDIPMPASIDFPKIIDPFNNELCNSLLQYVKFPNKNHYRSYFEVKYVPKLQQGVVATIEQSKYSIEKQLGKGTFGSVFRGFDINNQEVVALKYQKPGHPWEYYICQEIKARIHDPFMLPGYMDIRAAFLGDNASIFVSELSIYGSLLDVANRIKTATTKCISEFIVMLMTSEMLSIIHYLHKAEIIHADIKPDNFLVMKIPQTESRTPSLQLIDFGCAIDMSLFPDGTNFKKVISTDGFTCTEMRDGRPWTYQTDLFCLAGTVYVILMGSYMQTVNRGGQWYVEKKWPRYMKSNIWDRFFSTLLNVKDCSSIPDLLALKNTLDEFLKFEENNLSNQLRTFDHVLKCK